MSDDIFSKFEDDWDDDFGKDEAEEGEEWKPNPTKDLCKALSKKWQQVIFTLNGLLDVEPATENNDENDFFKERAAMYIGDAYNVMAKLRGAAAADMYVVYMENATFIRYYAQSVKASLLVFMAEDGIDELQVMALREQIDEFRVMFKEWVATFKVDEYEDEWGLFI